MKIWIFIIKQIFYITIRWNEYAKLLLELFFTVAWYHSLRRSNLCYSNPMSLHAEWKKIFLKLKIKNSSDKYAKQAHFRNKSDERWSGRRFYDNEGSESIESSRGCKLKEGREVKGDISPGKELEGAFALPPFSKGGLARRWVQRDLCVGGIKMRG